MLIGMVPFEVEYHVAFSQMSHDLEYVQCDAMLLQYILHQAELMFTSQEIISVR